jgi:hypothetical protein
MPIAQPAKKVNPEMAPEPEPGSAPARALLRDLMGAPKGHPKYGGGRPPGGLNRVTLEIKELAREYGPAGIARLAENRL